MSINAWVEIEKFLQYNLNKRIVNLNPTKRRKLRGSFKEEGSTIVHTGDEFMAYELVGCSAMEVYECYIKYFNYTIVNPYEKIRIGVSAEWIEEDEE